MNFHSLDGDGKNCKKYYFLLLLFAKPLVEMLFILTVAKEIKKKFFVLKAEKEMHYDTTRGLKLLNVD